MAVGHTENVILRFQPDDEITPFVRRIKEEVQGITSSLKTVDEGFDQIGSHVNNISSVLGGLVAKVSGVRNGLSGVNSELNESSDSIGGMTNHMSQFDRMVNEAKSHSSSLGSEFSSASKSVEGLTRDATGAKTAINLVGQAGRNMGTEVAQGSNVASKSLEGINKNTTGVSENINSLGGAFGGLAGSMTLVGIANAMWTGATQREFNKSYMAMEMGDAKAQDFVNTIQKIVAVVPGDDTFMNTLLQGSAIRGASKEDLSAEGTVAADYLAASQMTGQTQVEAQQDLNAYILTGNTGEVQRSRVLQGQVDTLENQKTVHDRILALNKALVANHFQGLSTLQVMTMKAGILKGEFQFAATNLGTGILPYLEKGVDFLITLDTKTGGVSTSIGIIVAGAIALAAALGPVVWAVKQTLSSIKGVGSGLKKITGRKHKIDIDCESDCPAINEGITGVNGSSSKNGKKNGKNKNKSGGKLSGLRNFLSDENGTIGSGRGLRGIGKLGGLVGKAGRLGANALRFAGPLGVLMDAGFAAEGAYEGWNSTKGNTGDKAKGAIGGAVDSFTMGLIPKDSVVNSINWVDKEYKTLSPKVSKTLKGIPTTAKKDLAKLGGIIASPFIDGFNGAKSWTSNGIKYVQNTVGGGINWLTTAFWNIPGEVGGAMKAMYDQIKNWTDQGIGWLKKLYCMVVGCSPGVIPAFKKMSEDVPNYLNRTSPHIRSFSKLINAPDLKADNLVTNEGSGGKVEYHKHYHTNTFDLANIDKHELASALIEIYEGASTENMNPKSDGSTDASASV